MCFYSGYQFLGMIMHSPTQYKHCVYWVGVQILPYILTDHVHLEADVCPNKVTTN